MTQHLFNNNSTETQMEKSRNQQGKKSKYPFGTNKLNNPTQLTKKSWNLRVKHLGIGQSM